MTPGGDPAGVALIKKYNLKSDPNDKPKINAENIVPVIS